MSWTWSEAGAAMTGHGQHFPGYSGNGAGKNNPAMEAAVGIGPVPRGTYTMTGVESGGPTGPFTIIVDPCEGTDTCGRSAFRIHGDSISHPGQASHGCIILPLVDRKAIWASGDRDLEVVE